MGTDAAAKRGLSPAIMKVRGLSKRFVQRTPFSHKKFAIDALVDVEMDIAPGCVTALVGESGSGKSTLANCLAMLERADSGEIWFEGQEISRWKDRQLAPLRSKIQMVFQDSAGALNPRFSAARIIEEPLEIQNREHGAGLRGRACEVLAEVGLAPEWAERSPLELSGGQRQRLAIGRAIALKPALLILDESLSGLDLSTQAQILNLLLDLKQTHALTYLLISHDLSLVGQIADFVGVMQHGGIVEFGAAPQVLGSPRHDETRRLLASARGLESAYRTARAGGRA